MLAPPMEPCIGMNNQPFLTISTGVLQVPKALKLPMIEEFIAIMTANNAGVNRVTRGAHKGKKS